MLRVVARHGRHEDGLVHQLVVIIAVSVLSGILIAGLALPYVALVNKGADTGAAAVRHIPLRLHFGALNEKTVVLDSKGNRLASFYDENRKYVSLSKIAMNMQHAIIAIEDSRFYDHGAIDLQGTLRAFIVNQANAGVVQGGSSITQQLVKLTRLENATNAKQTAAAQDETVARKFEELRYAVWVERHLTKKQILEHYLNAAYYGDGAYGIEAAAHHYFSVSAARLSLPQSAMLAGLVRNPSGYNPTIDRHAAHNRRNTVIGRMLELHVINTREANAARRSPLGLHMSYVANGCVNTSAPWFCDYLLNYLLQDRDLGRTAEERRHMIYAGGLTIKSTIDLRFQRAADDSVTSKVYPKDRAIGGLAMVEPGTGYVRALSQSRPMGNNKKRGQTFLNYVVPDRYGDSRGFQPGSTFKAFVLAQAIKDHIPLNTTINAPPSITVNLGDYQICGGQNYPSTATHTFTNSTESGNMTLYTGTQLSVNTFYVQLEKLTGLCGPWHLAKQMGVELTNPNGANGTMVPSFTLGVADVSPLEMAEAYATFPARGMHCDSTPILEIRDRNGDVLPTSGTRCQRILKPAYADAINDILRGVQEGNGFGASAGLALGQPSAGKTGTSQDGHSVWFIGYTPTLTTAAMLAGANSQGSPIGLDYQTIGGINIGFVHGSSTAGPIWYGAMSKLTKWLPDKDFVVPDPTIVKGQTVPIPSYYGYNPDTAAQALSKLGFKPQIASSVYSSAPYGTVAYTSPSGEGVSGAPVSIYISSGPPPVVKPPPSSPPGGGNPGGGGPGGGGPTGGGPGGGGPTSTPPVGGGPAPGGGTPSGGGTSPGTAGP